MHATHSLCICGVANQMFLYVICLYISVVSCDRRKVTGVINEAKNSNLYLDLSDEKTKSAFSTKVFRPKKSHFIQIPYSGLTQTQTTWALTECVFQLTIDSKFTFHKLLNRCTILIAFFRCCADSRRINHFSPVSLTHSFPLKYNASFSMSLACK
jgi:hypothetical protein